MSRSRRPKCKVGRGCRCCGNAGAARRLREADRFAECKDRLVKDTGNPYRHDSYYMGKSHRWQWA